MLKNFLFNSTLFLGAAPALAAGATWGSANPPPGWRDSRLAKVQPHQSLLDATTANFALTNAIWLFEPLNEKDGVNVAVHLRQTLGTVLTSYPQWAGQLKSIAVVDDVSVPAEAQEFPAHARRFGRVYAHFGASADVGVEFISGTSSATTDSLYPTERVKTRPLWDRKDETLGRFVPAVDIAHALQPNEPDAATGLRKPIMAIQCTTFG
ncbi:predicted protein [Plenodomus lingam JN3]|uniref:Uncharacterized protein n=1 Tax=Leptosphaeria maculans (strain JN3 / isolate v23.1.3 / race Av1-4-5-6-7-8) TaxID=985895 RepID=E5A6S6_LEPMJ|nr:predicted protein [Plenodomus lingam JN3]CBX99321.1 predicted protein [Plenodomus lingam JN3]